MRGLFELRWMRIALIAMVPAFLCWGCGDYFDEDEIALSGEDPDVEYVDLPIIQSFSADPPDFVVEGNSLILSWTIHEAEWAGIEPDVGEVDPRSGSIELFPVELTVYELTASNAAGPVTETARIDVVEGCGAFAAPGGSIFTSHVVNLFVLVAPGLAILLVRRRRRR